MTKLRAGDLLLVGSFFCDLGVVVIPNPQRQRHRAQANAGLDEADDAGHHCTPLRLMRRVLSVLDWACSRDSITIELGDGSSFAMRRPLIDRTRVVPLTVMAGLWSCAAQAALRACLSAWASELEGVHAAARLRLLAAVCVSCNLTSVA